MTDFFPLDGCVKRILLAVVALCVDVAFGMNGFYVWQRQWTDQVEATVDAELKRGTHELFVLGGELEGEKGTVKWRGVQVPARIWRHSRVSAVFRLPVRTLDQPESTAAVLVARALALDVRRIQLDVDVPERLMARYAALVESLRHRWPASAGPLRLGATFLPCHLGLKDVRRVLSVLDDPVIQLHGIDAPKDSHETWHLMRREVAFQALRNARRLDGRFKMALPSYAYVLTFNADGRFRRLYAEGLPDDFDLPPGGVRRLAAPDLTLLHEILQSPLRLPVIWFRLPVCGVDRWCLERETVALLERGQKPEATIEFSVRNGGRPGTEDFVACYRHQIPLSSVTVRIDWETPERGGEFFPLNGCRLEDGSVHGRLPEVVRLPPFACGVPFVFGKAIARVDPRRISIKVEEKAE